MTKTGIETRSRTAVTRPAAGVTPPSTSREHNSSLAAPACSAARAPATLSTTDSSRGRGSVRTLSLTPLGCGRMKRTFVAASLVAAAVTLTEATVRLPSADGQFWDIQDTSPWAQDSGGIATGGGANPFNGFGYLKLEVRTAAGEALARNVYLRGFGLAHDGGDRLDSITPVFASGVAIDRAMFAPRDTNYLRYVDSFTNTTREPRLLRVAWGGAAGAFEDGG